MDRQLIFRIGVSLLLFTCDVPAQSQSFEIASIKINNSGNPNSSMGPRGGRLVATNMTLRALLMYAYRPQDGHLLDAQVVGAPDWAKVDRFDIEAKPAGAAEVRPGEPTRSMLRSLLEERFGLKVHREARDLPVYTLVLTAKGPKVSEDQTPPDPRQAFISVVSQGAEAAPLPRGALRMTTAPTTTTLIGRAVPIATVVTLLQGQSDHIIVDRTDFDRLIDVHLEFSQQPLAGLGGRIGPEVGDSGTVAPTEVGPSLFTAIQEAGLRLQPGKARLDVVVVDAVHRPSAN
jgi:uncharacterized protein (TIGR03435 family)